MKIEISERNGQYYFDIEGIASGVSKDIHSAISEVREIVDNQTLITDFPCGVTVTAQLESMGHMDDMNVYKFVDEMGRRFTHYSENEEILPVVFDRWYEYSDAFYFDKNQRSMISITKSSYQILTFLL